MYNIGKKIKSAREMKGFSRREIASKLNMSYSTYSNYENQKRKIPLPVLLEISDLLDIDITFFTQTEFDDFAEWKTDKLINSTHSSDTVISKYKELNDLLQAEVEKIEKVQKTQPTTRDLQRFASDPIAEHYEQLNEDGKKEATKRVEELTYIPKYTKKEDK